MHRTEKTELVSFVEGLVSEKKAVVLMHYRGLSAAQMSTLRMNLKDSDANLKIVKNTLTKRAIGETAYESLAEHLTGPVAISYSEDPVSLSKALADFAKENEALDILAGCMDGDVYTIDKIKALASLGSKDEVRAKFIGLLSAAQSGFVRLLDAKVNDMESGESKEASAE